MQNEFEKWASEYESSYDFKKWASEYQFRKQEKKAREMDRTISFIFALVCAIIFFFLSLYEALNNSIGWSMFALFGSCVCIAAAYFQACRDILDEVYNK